MVFDFNASLNDVVPLSPILLPVGLIRIKKSRLQIDATHMLFLCAHPPDQNL